MLSNAERETKFYKVYLFFEQMIGELKQEDKPLGQQVRNQMHYMDYAAILELRDGLREMADFLERHLLERR